MNAIDFRDLDRRPLPADGALPFKGHEALAQKFRAALETPKATTPHDRAIRETEMALREVLP